jgi:hypothetical protein
MTMYAHVVDNIILGVPAMPPGSARRISDQAWISPPGGLINGTVAEQESCGYFVVTETEQPIPAANQRVEGPTYTMVAGRPTQQWSLRPATPDELTAQTRAANQATLTLGSTILTKLTEMETFFTDPDVVAARDQPNNTALSVQVQNRYNKAIHTQMRRYKNMLERIARYTGVSELLDDISGT